MVPVCPRRRSSGVHPGDPRCAAEVIVEAGEASEPPFHLLLDKNAVASARPKLDLLRRDLDAFGVRLAGRRLSERRRRSTLISDLRALSIALP